MELIYSAVHLD